jgi:hypothetical protein
MMMCWMCKNGCNCSWGAYLSFFTSFMVASMEKGNPGWLLEGLKITESKFGKSFIATTRSARLLHVCVVRV